MGIDSIISTVLSPILSIIDKAVPDRTEATRLKAEIEKAVIENRSELQQTMREIAVAEVKGDRFQRSWRPLLSYVFIFLMAWNGFLHGLVETAIGVPIDTISTSDLLTFGGLWSAAYGLGRTFEKTGSKIAVGKGG